MSKSKLLATKAPSHLQSEEGLGNENVGMDHFEIPRVKLLQKLSSETDQSTDRYVDGAKAGMLYNTVSGKAADTILVLNLRFTPGFTALNKSNGQSWMASNGQTMFATEDGEDDSLRTMMEADATIDMGEYEIKPIHRHDLLLLDEDDGVIESPAVIEFVKSKLKVSQVWNTNIAGSKGDRFSHVWEIGSETIKWNSMSWFNFTVNQFGVATDELHGQAKEIFKTLK